MHIKNNKKGIYSPEGKELIPTIYTDLNYLTDDYIIVSQNKKYGIVNLSNKLIIPLKYDKIYIDWYKVAYQGQAPEIFVLKNNVYSQIDRKHKLIRTDIQEKEVKDKFDNLIEILEPENNTTSND